MALSSGRLRCHPAPRSTKVVRRPQLISLLFNQLQPLSLHSQKLDPPFQHLGLASTKLIASRDATNSGPSVGQSESFHVAHM